MNKKACQALVFWINMWLFVGLSLGSIWIGSTLPVANSVFWILFTWCLLAIIGAIGCFIAFLVQVLDS